MSLDQFPDEILQHLLLYLPPEDNLATFQRLSRRMNTLAREPLLWRHHCQTRFQYWDPRHDFSTKLGGRASATNWMGIFKTRLRRNSRAARLLDRVVDSGPNNVEGYGELARLGYDIKDFLLEQSRTPDYVEDVLARRYYSIAILDSIHRSMALDEWRKLQRIRQDPRISSSSMYEQEAELSLERIIAGLDMFVLHDQVGDIDHISALLDQAAADFCNDVPHVHDLSTRQKALALNFWLRVSRLIGVTDPDVNYYNLRNCFLGQSLRHHLHGSLPIISCAIFASIAGRLGINAKCCVLPNHVHIIVYAPPGEALDVRPCDRPCTPPATTQATTDLGDRERMFLDPHGLDDEVPLADIQACLASFQIFPPEKYLRPTPPSLVALRAASNIQVAVIGSRRAQSPEPLRLLGPPNPMNGQDSLYASHWISVMMTSPTEDNFERDQDVLLTMQYIEKFCPGDVWLIHEYMTPLWHYFRALAPLYQPGYLPGDFRTSPHAPISWQETLGKRPSKPSLRNTLATRILRFKVGQVVRHRRYNCIAIVTGWDVNDASGRDSQPFREVICYTILRADTCDPWYVMQDSLQLVTDAALISDVLFFMAGKYFRRFDPLSCTFVSNVKLLFPDD